MRPPALPLFLAALLAGCGAPGSQAPRGGGTAHAEPARAILYADTLTVEMTDRSFCTGPRRATGQAWSGTLAGCPYEWAYEVQLPPYRIARLPLTAGEGGAGRAEITSPAGGRYVFTGPK
jgi:hypothetical protein